MKNIYNLIQILQSLDFKRSRLQWMCFGLFSISILIGESLKAQVFPQPYNGWPTNWTFTGFAGAEAATRYPGNGANGTATVGTVAATMGGTPNNVTSFNTANMGFYGYTTGGAPEAALPNQMGVAHNQTFIAVYTSRMFGDGVNGFSFQTTGTANANTILSPGGGYPGSALLALNTTGRTNVSIASTARLQATLTYNAGTQNRDYAIRLQYRVGTTGAFKDFSSVVQFNSLATPTTYRATGASGALNATLPNECDNQPVVHVRWLYHSIGGTAGTRPRMQFDEITVSSSAVAGATVFSNPSNLDFPNTTVSTSSAEQLLDVSALNLSGSSFTVTAPADFEVSLTSGSGFGSSVSFTPVAGTVANSTVFVRFSPGSAGLKSGNIVIAGSGATNKNVAVSGTGIAPVTYYSKSTGNLELTGTWGYQYRRNGYFTGRFYFFRPDF